MDYNKICTVISETKNNYTYKDGKNMQIIRKYKDYLHPKSGITTKRELLSIEVTGTADHKEKEEVRVWVKNRCSPPIPKMIKKFMDEQ